MRILIVRLSSLGDIVMSMSCLQFIKKSLPHARIEWLVDSRFSEVLAHNQHLSAIHVLPLRDNRKNIPKAILAVLKLKRKLGRFDLVIDMQGLMKSAVIARTMGKYVVGYDQDSCKEKLSSFFYNQKAHVSYSAHIHQRNFALIRKGLGIDVSAEQIENKQPYLFYHSPVEDFNSFLSLDKKNILVVIGGSWNSKIYPKESLKEVIDHIRENVLILWSNAEEYERAKWIVSQTPHAKILPKMSLNDLKALIDRCDLILGNDTGPCHMAWAMNKPSVTILGCTSITRIPVNANNLAVTSKTCVNPYKINKDDLSIRDIPSREVVDCLQKLF